MEHILFHCEWALAAWLGSSLTYNWKEFQKYMVNRDLNGVLEATMMRVETWCPPPVDQFKINCDVEIAKGSTKAAIAAILHNHRGDILDGR